MKRVVLSMILIALIMTTLFVSCDNNLSKDAGTASVRFATAENVARGLNKVNPELNPSDLYWRYEAVKKDDVGLSTGATSKQELIGNDGKLSNPVGPFSLGDWEFTLYGYVDSEATKLAYTGKTTATIKADKVNNVAVTVKALMTSEGIIEFPTKGVIELKDKNNQSIQSYKEIIVISNADDGSVVKTLTDSEVRTVTVASGSYKVTIKYTNSDESLVYGENAIYINVWDNLTTKIGGSLDEITGNTTFDPINGTAESIEQTIKTDAITNIAVNSSPVMPNGGDNTNAKVTTVEIPAGAVEGTKAKLGVKAYSADNVGKLTIVDETSAVIGGLDLTLTVDNAAVTEFSSPVTVTTYIAKGLTDVKVKYIGTGDQPTDVNYDSVTGKLTFKTTHFSEFYVTSEDAARIGLNYYSDLRNAISALQAGDTLTMLKDFEYTDAAQMSSDNALTISVPCTIDGNNKKIFSNLESAEKGYRLLNIWNVKEGDVVVRNLSLHSVTNSSYYCGLNISQNENAHISLDNVNVQIPDYYAIDIVKDNVKLKMTLENGCLIQGWCTLYNHASDLYLEGHNCTFNSISPRVNGGESNSFGNIIVADYYQSGFSDDSRNNTMKFDSCRFSAVKPDVTDVTQVVFDLRSPGNNKLYLNECICTEVAEPVYIKSVFDTAWCNSMAERNQFKFSNKVFINGVDVTKDKSLVMNELDKEINKITDYAGEKPYYPYNPLVVLFGATEGTSELKANEKGIDYLLTSEKTSEDPETWKLTVTEIKQN